MELNENILSQRRPLRNCHAYGIRENGDFYKIICHRAEIVADKVRLRKKRAIRCRLQKDAIEYRLNNGIDMKAERKAERETVKRLKAEGKIRVLKRNRTLAKKRKK